MTKTPLDWTLAQETAARLARPGPKATMLERRELVADLRASSREAVEIVAETTLLEPTSAGQVLVVDRANWSRSVIEGLGQMVGPGIPQTSLAAARGAGVEIGGLIAILATRVLGQYDPWASPEAGRLTLVAPNILASERVLDANPQAFRMWVCLHEQTHVTQFATAPWLVDYLADLVQNLTASIMDREQARERAATLLRGLVNSLRDPESPSLLEITATEAELAQLDRITAVMSLLEGHADVIMDSVSDSVVPGVAKIRSAFDARRAGDSPDRRKIWDLLVRRLLGLDTKLAQYREGAHFVRSVEKQVGRAGLNRVWEAPETLPTIAELRSPEAWVARVHAA